MAWPYRVLGSPVGDTALELTRREFELLELLASEGGKVLAREEILLLPWRLDWVRREMAVGNAERPYVVRPDRLYTRDDLMHGWRPGADHSSTLDGRIYDTSTRTVGALPT